MRPLFSPLSAAILAASAVLAADPARAQCLNWGTEFAATPVPDVYAIASFDDGSGPAVYFASTGFVRRFDGAGWSIVGNGTGFQAAAGQSYLPVVHCLEVFDDGGGPKLYAGGRFQTVDGVPALCLARWDGASWASAGDPLNPAFRSVLAMRVFDPGTGPELYRAIEGTQSSSSSLARFDGASWAGAGEFGNGTVGFARVDALAAHDAGSGPALYAGGRFTTVSGVAALNVARQDPSSGVWSALAGGLDNDVYALASHDDGSGPALYAGGIFSASLSAWNGSAWTVSGGGTNAAVHAFAQFDDGDGYALYAGGDFTQIGGVPANLVARKLGPSWSPLGSGLVLPGGPSAAVLALAVHVAGPPEGRSLVVGGRFSRAGDTASARVARWRACPGPIDLFCAGDGTLAACPCGNTGTSGRGCQNSSGSGGARLLPSGGTNPDTLALSVSGELASSLTIFLQGSARVAAGTGFGDGLRCAGGTLKRLFVKSASSGNATAPEAGDPTISARSAALGNPIAPGSLRYYQTYYRDASALFCPPPTGSTFNASSGVRVIW